MDKASPARATSLLRSCKCGCGTEFKPKRVDQRFATPSCKTKYTMEAYEEGLKVIESKGMHHRTMDNPVMQRLHALMSDGEPRTTKEIRLATGIESVNTAIGELRRASGKKIKCTYVGKTETGAKLFEYRLIGE